MKSGTSCKKKQQNSEREIREKALPTLQPNVLLKNSVTPQYGDRDRGALKEKVIGPWNYGVGGTMPFNLKHEQTRI